MTGGRRPERPASSMPGGRARGHAALDRPTGTLVTPDELQVRRRPVTPPGGGAGGDGRGPGRVASWLRGLFERDALVLAAILVLAAALRFWGLETRGRFDGDQGHDMLVLLSLIRDGSIPLLGPPTSIGDFHHGAAYYYLLAPAAWLSGADPTIVVGWIATLGVAAVAATWWFARSVGGRVAAAIAGVLMAVSPAEISASTFLWNPNPIPLFAAIALGCAWRAHAGSRAAASAPPSAEAALGAGAEAPPSAEPAPGAGRAARAARWWIPAIVAAGMVVQLHVLGIVFLPPILALAVADVVRARRAREAAIARATVRAVAGGLALAALLFVPLLVHELGSGFEETRRVGEYLAGGGEAGALDPFLGLAITFFRVVGWPLVGLVTDAPAGAILAVTVATVLTAWLALAGRQGDGTAARWLGLTVAWTALALTVLSPSLQAVVAALPNDHYHAFADPAVIVLVAVSARAVARGGGPGGRIDAAARTLVAAALAGLVVLDLRLMPLTDPNGGWPAAREAGEAIVAGSDGPYDVRGLPVFKSAEGVAFPIVVAGGEVTVATDAATGTAPLRPDAVLVLACDRIFEDVIGDACGGPAEARYLARLGAAPSVVERFDLSPRIAISIYRP
ncbi:MAG TPA: hypothetical protein VFX65_03090 [Candidatus Limnocylindrales bacterium]|nr:hypothetical protein [Candidatus Limnocylindrales bacterium]